MDFEDEFEDFYYNRYDEVNILDEALPSVKSESTKQNKSLKIQYSNDQHKKGNVYKSSISREKNQHYGIDIAYHPTSDAFRGKQDQGQKKKNLKKQKSRKQLDLIERSKKHEKSLGRNLVQKDRSPMNMKKSNGQSGLKRIKSSTALLDMLKKKR